MADIFSVQNSLGAGLRLKSDLANATQNRDFNSLRLSGERQRQDVAQRAIDTEEKQALGKKMLVGIDLVERGLASGDLSIIPKVSDEFLRSQMIDEEEQTNLLQLAQTDLPAFKREMAALKSEIQFALAQPLVKPKFGAAQAATRDGENVLIQTSPSGVTQEVEGFGPPAGGGGFGGEPATLQLFNVLSEAAAEVGLDGKPTRRAIQAQTQLGTRARAGTTSSRERIATDEDLTESVAESEATIAQARKFGEATGALRSKLIDKGVESIKSIDQNLRNLDKAIAAIDEGAATGAIISRFTPTVRAATVKLEQVRSELGLDVVGGVTFGALSKGELDLALTVALPVNLKPAELRQWLLDKQDAVKKLRAYYIEQIDFLDQGGTVAGFLREKQRQLQTNQGGNNEQLIQPFVDPALLEFMTPEERALFGQ